MTQESPRASYRRDRWFVAAFFALSLLSSPWRYPLTSDGAAMLASARSLIRSGTLAIDPSFTTDNAYVPSARRGPDGRVYAKYGVAVVLSQVPFAAAAVALARAGLPDSLATPLVMSLVNPLLSAATLLVALRLGRAMGLSAPQLRFAGLAIALGSFWWALSVSDFGEPLQTLLVTAAMLALSRYERTRPTATLWIAGALAGVAFLAKAFLLVLVPAFVAAALVNRPPGQGVRRAIAIAGPIVLPVAAAIGLQLGLNVIRWGTPFESGYLRPMMTSPIDDGLWGLLLSPTRGLLFYAPPIALAPAGLWYLARARPALATLVAAAAALLTVSSALYFEWGGGWCWGPRYLSPVLPALGVAAAFAYRGVAVRTVASVLLAAGIGINGLGVVVSEDAYRRTVMRAWHWYLAGTMRAGTASFGIIDIPRRPEDILPSFSSIAGHWWLARVALVPCDCAETPIVCRCADGPLEQNAVFRNPPWRQRYPAYVPDPPWGRSSVEPAALRWLYRRYVFDPAR